MELAGEVVWDRVRTLLYRAKLKIIVRWPRRGQYTRKLAFARQMHLESNMNQTTFNHVLLYSLYCLDQMPPNIPDAMLLMLNRPSIQQAVKEKVGGIVAQTCTEPPPEPQ